MTRATRLVRSGKQGKQARDGLIRRLLTRVLAPLGLATADSLRDHRYLVRTAQRAVQHAYVALDGDSAERKLRVKRALDSTSLLLALYKRQRARHINNMINIDFFSIYHSSSSESSHDNHPALAPMKSSVWRKEFHGTAMMNRDVAE